MAMTALLQERLQDAGDEDGDDDDVMEDPDSFEGGVLTPEEEEDYL